jgi:hypothetical protein
MPIRAGMREGMGPVGGCQCCPHFGVAVADPVTLSDSNNVVEWLRPAPVVAKVGTGHLRRLGWSWQSHGIWPPAVRPWWRLPARCHG